MGVRQVRSLWRVCARSAVRRGGIFGAAQLKSHSASATAVHTVGGCVRLLSVCCI